MFLWGCVVSLVNGCSILITAGTSESHVPRPLQITRVNHLTPCMPKGLRSYLDPNHRLKPHIPQLHRGRSPLVSSLARRSRLCHGATPERNVPDFIKDRLKARGGHFNCDLFSLWGCWTHYKPTVASAQNDDVMVSVFAKCKYQKWKKLCPLQHGSSLSFREKKAKATTND